MKQAGPVLVKTIIAEPYNNVNQFGKISLHVIPRRLKNSLLHKTPVVVYSETGLAHGIPMRVETAVDTQFHSQSSSIIMGTDAPHNWTFKNIYGQGHAPYNYNNNTFVICKT